MTWEFVCIEVDQQKQKEGKFVCRFLVDRGLIERAQFARQFNLHKMQWRWVKKKRCDDDGFDILCANNMKQLMCVLCIC